MVSIVHLSFCSKRSMKFRQSIWNEAWPTRAHYTASRFLFLSRFCVRSSYIRTVEWKVKIPIRALRTFQDLCLFRLHANPWNEWSGFLNRVFLLLDHLMKQRRLQSHNGLPSQDVYSDSHLNLNRWIIFTCVVVIFWTLL